MIDDSSFGLWVVAWLVVAVVIALLHHRRSRHGAGLVLTWLLSLALIHWLAAAVYASPWYPVADPEFTQQGFLQSFYALSGFGIGVLFLAPLLRFLDPPSPTDLDRGPIPSARSFSMMYVAVGSVAYFILERLIGGIPTLAAVVGTGSYVVVGGLCLACWEAIELHQGGRLAGWLTLSAIYPIGTVVTQGFLGYGAAATLAVASFVAVRYRPRGRVLVVALVVTYLALSVYVTYMRDRGSIRDSVWGGAAFSERFDRLLQSVSTFEWFDPTDTEHLARIDARLNQNALVGAAMTYLGQGNRSFANGQTIWDAIIAVIPRAIWPDKPVIAGSGSLVSDYTGIDFAYGTSVGIGPVLEFYINFGTPGVVVGFLVIGALIGALDRSAGRSLAGGHIDAFTYRYMPALSLMNVGGSLVELTSSAAAAIAMVLLLNRLLLPIFWREQATNRWRRTFGPSRWVPPSASSPVLIEKQG
jgi:hypothetical protein